jgi:hypothetical protein
MQVRKTEYFWRQKRKHCDSLDMILVEGDTWISDMGIKC